MSNLQIKELSHFEEAGIIREEPCYLPFDANTYNPILTQGFDGPWSHKKISVSTDLYNYKMDLTYSTDWALDPGTLVRATRAGIVRIIFDQSDAYYEGEDSETGIPFALAGKTNFVVVVHPNKMKSIYSHLWKDSIRVRVGQQVERGQELAESGKSGWIGPIPHLHFHMVSDNVNIKSSPFTFIDYPDSLYHKDIPI